MRTQTAGNVSRSRWAAIGAAITVALGAGGLLTASAADSSPTTYVATTPCRVVDTRAGSENVGPRSTPIGPKETFSTAFVGAVGRCNIPANAVAVVLNLAIVNPTASSYLTVFPAGGTVPLAANLNFVAGQPPASNAATVQIGTGGQLSFYNLAGTVDVTADVSGYYLPAGTSPAPTPKTRTLTFDGVALEYLEPATRLSVLDCVAPGSGNYGGTIAVPLPVGATIEGWSVKVFDSAGGATWSARLERITVGASGASSATVYAPVSGGAATNTVTSGYSTGNPLEVVGEDETFRIFVTLGLNSSNGLCQVKVTYTEP